jgi:hypothetical protein
MENNDPATIADLSDTELDMVAAGKGLTVSVPTSVNINLAVPTQVATNVAVLSAATQTILQGIGVFQKA